MGYVLYLESSEFISKLCKYGLISIQLYDVTDFWVTLKSNKGSSHRVLRYKLMKREHDPMGPKFTLKPPDKCKGKSNVDAEGDTSMLDESTAT